MSVHTESEEVDWCKFDGWCSECGGDPDCICLTPPPRSESLRSAVAALFVRRVTERVAQSWESGPPSGWVLAYCEPTWRVAVYATGWLAGFLRFWRDKYRWLFELGFLGTREEGGYFNPRMGGYWTVPWREFPRRRAEIARRLALISAAPRRELARRWRKVEGPQVNGGPQ